ncbi:toll-like receptor 13 [Periophthalmus magnuspinnatus]|uniref:toll-like receptor 13 n=1 Tax=Periophthalmus magnuspinnatus TaxID=409849 RepID=UPI00145BDF27|nr:toll-like receptor 13 [Periophthalmus magnuspinnatus]
MGHEYQKILICLFLLNIQSFVVQGFALRNCRISLNVALCDGNKLTLVPTDILPTIAYAYYMLVAWLFDTKNKNRKASNQYDAFVSYNVHDEAWVYRKLVPHLEKNQGWKLCLHHRDFEPGKPIVENITDAIYGSRKTLCVISRRYLQSEWCSREMQVASFRLFDERKDVLILVFLEDIPSAHLSPYYRMRKVLRRQTYLRWPGIGPGEALFWEKLRKALTSTESKAEDRLLLTVTSGH